MPIEFACQCGKQYRVDDHYAGKMVRCKQCASPIRIPLPPIIEEIPDEADQPYNVVMPDASAGYRPAGEPVAGNWMGGISNIAQSSKPGRLRVNYLLWFTCFPMWPVLTVATVAVSLAAAGVLNKHFAWGALGGLGLMVSAYFRIRGHMGGGDTVPAVVLSIRPPRIAAMTDLATGGHRSLWAVKIAEHPFGRMVGGPFQPGQRLAAVALYGMPAEGHESQWSDFFPVAVNCATRDPAALRYAFSKLTEGEFRRLESAIPQLPNLNTGLHTLWDNNQSGGKLTNSAIILMGMRLAVIAYIVGVIVLMVRANH